MLEASVPAGTEAPIRFYVTEDADGAASLTYRLPRAAFARIAAPSSTRWPRSWIRSGEASSPMRSPDRRSRSLTYRQESLHAAPVNGETTETACLEFFPDKGAT
jgi:hypothetical protein